MAVSLRFCCELRLLAFLSCVPAALTVSCVSVVAGHKGQLVFGALAGKCVMCMQGRVHGYEGYSQQQVRLLKKQIRLEVFSGAVIMVTSSM